MFFIFIKKMKSNEVVIERLWRKFHFSDNGRIVCSDMCTMWYAMEKQLCFLSVKGAFFFYYLRYVGIYLNYFVKHVNCIWVSGNRYTTNFYLIQMLKVFLRLQKWSACFIVCNHRKKVIWSETYRKFLKQITF